MNIIVNVGLVASMHSAVFPGEPINPNEVRAVLAEMGFRVVRSEVKESATEPTLVAELESGRILDVSAALCTAAEMLDQDAIAFATKERGEVVGPRSADWGEFNPEYFLEF